MQLALLISFPDLRLFVSHIFIKFLKSVIKGFCIFLSIVFVFLLLINLFKIMFCNIWNVFLSRFCFMFGEIGKVKIFSRADDGFANFAHYITSL